jgi:hypothetical protein
MWKLHLQSNEGVAIQSSPSRLSESFRPTPHEVHIGEVAYLDYSKESFGGIDNIFWPFLYKRKSFEHERELRAIIWEPRHDQWKGVGEQNVRAGVSVQVTLETLIEKVYVSPTARGWFLDLVASVSKRYGIVSAPQRSDLDRDPLL